MNARDVAVYRSKRVLDMYVYVDEACDPMALPKDLLKRFGKPVEAMRFKPVSYTHLTLPTKA